MVKNTIWVVDGKAENVDFSVAVIEKSDNTVLVILKGFECIIYNGNGTIQDYKRFDDEESAYMKWLCWIGEMCKKDSSSDYFLGTHEMDTLINVNDRCNISILIIRISKYISESIYASNL